MKWFSIVIAILFLSPIVMAKGDLKQYSYSEYNSQKHAPILVEWFHGEGDEEYGHYIGLWLDGSMDAIYTPNDYKDSYLKSRI